MSSDDSIVTLKTPKITFDGDEFRVENIGSLHWDLIDEQREHGNCDRILLQIRDLFKMSPVFHTEEAAEKFRDELFERLQKNGLPEYGDTHITLSHPLWRDPWGK